MVEAWETDLKNLACDVRFEVLKEQQKPQDELLWHYTTLDGMHGMLQSKNFWCTDVTFTNDSSEVLHGLQKIEIAVRKIAKVTASKSTRKMLNWICDDLFYWTKYTNFYIACFCEDGDNLSQWRGYGASGKGVSLGFLPRNFDDNFAGNKGVTLKKVIYDEDRQEAIINMALERAKTIFQAYADSRNLSGQPRATLLKQFIAELYPMFLEICLHFKSAAFKDEREWRLVVMKRPEPDKNPPLKTRVSGDLIVPYVEHPMTINPRSRSGMFLREIKQGPCSDVSRGIRSINILLDLEGASHINPEQSNVPFNG